MDSLPSTSNSILESELAQDAGRQDAGELEQVNHLRRLYREVLYFYIKDKKISYEAMDAAISAVIVSFRYSEGHRFSEVDYNREDMCCGFIFRYAAHGAALARCRILEGLDRCPELKSILRKKEVTLASLGCGPGNDAIGFCSAMSRAKFSGTLKKIFLVDAISNWSDYAFKAVRLLCQGGFGEVSDLFQRKKVEIVLFRQRTLPEQLNTLRLSQFDVVLICKLMSILNRREVQRLPRVRILFAVKAYFKLSCEVLL